MSLTAKIGRQMSNHPALYPMMGCFVAAGVLVGGYFARLVLKSPDCCWTRNNPYPQQQYMGVQYKFWREKLQKHQYAAPAERPVLPPMQPGS